MIAATAARTRKARLTTLADTIRSGRAHWATYEWASPKARAKALAETGTVVMPMAAVLRREIGLARGSRAGRREVSLNRFTGRYVAAWAEGSWHEMCRTATVLTPAEVPATRPAEMPVMRITIRPDATPAERRLVADAKHIAEDFKAIDLDSPLAKHLLRRSIAITEQLGYEPIS